MKLLSDNFTLKIMNKINNPFGRRTSVTRAKIVGKTLYELSFSCISLSDSLSISCYARKLSINNIKALRSRGSTLQFIPYNTRKSPIILIPSIDELSVLKDTDGGLFYWISDEDEVYPLIDMEKEYTEGLHHNCYNRARPLSHINSIFI